MDQRLSIGIIAGICILVLAITLAKKYAQIFFNFLVRAVLGAIGILFANDFFQGQALQLSVGLNPATLLTVGILGFGGFVLLYAIVASKYL